MTQAAPVSLTIRRQLAEPSLWHHNGREIQLGCAACVDRGPCGGLSVGAPIHNCLDLCCGKPETCQRYACPLNPERYTALVNEVGGFELRPFRGRIASMPALPDYIPCLLDSGSLGGPVHLPTVAVPLHSVIDCRSGLARFSSREEVLARFKVYGEARIVLTGVATDRHVEAFWPALLPKQTAMSLKRLRPAFITVPNFSLHADTVRHDNLLSMARIAACVEEFAVAGLPVVPHINARTPRDYERWAEYLINSADICAIACEMGSMGRSASRRAWHAAQFVELARLVKRPLTLVVRGGTAHLADLGAVFHRVMLLDTTPHMKAKMRQSATYSHGTLTWTPSPTAAGQAVDEILLHNVRSCQRAFRATQPRPTSAERRPATRQGALEASDSDLFSRRALHGNSEARHLGSLS